MYSHHGFQSIIENFYVFLCFMALISLFWYHWKRRHLYIISTKCTGPFAWPIVGNLLQFGTSLDGITKGFIEFGTYPTVRRIWLGNKLMLSVSTPETACTILTSVKCLHKPEIIYGAFKILAGNGLFTAPVDIWKVHRKIINPTMNQKLLNNFMDIFNERATVFKDLMKKRIGTGEFDIFHPMCSCTLDIICETIMGIEVDAQNNDLQYLSLVQSIMSSTMKMWTNFFYRIDFIFKRTNTGKQTYKNVKAANDFVLKVIKKKKEEVNKNVAVEKCNNLLTDDVKPKRKAFLEYILEENKFTDQELLHHVHTMMIGGSDTSGTVMSFTCVMIAMHPEVQKKLFIEVDDIFGDSDREVTIEDLSRLEYLERVIKENLRMYPITLGVVRETTDEIILGGITVPAGILVAIDMYNMHRDPKYWPEPMRFDPDRFLPEQSSKRHPYAYIPFSSGTRNCIGLRFGMMSMKVVLSTILRNYKMTTSYKCIEDFKIEWHMIFKSVHGCNISLELREK